MSKVIASAATSVDGFVADTDDAVGPLFDWYGNGEVAITGADPDRVFHVTEATAGYLRANWVNIGAMVAGRHLFDLTNGWNGRPPIGDHVFVVTHKAPRGLAVPRRAVHVRHRRPGQRDSQGQGVRRGPERRADRREPDRSGPRGRAR
jgi:dihydrofolate reductase